MKKFGKIILAVLMAAMIIAVGIPSSNFNRGGVQLI